MKIPPVLLKFLNVIISITLAIVIPQSSEIPNDPRVAQRVILGVLIFLFFSELEKFNYRQSNLKKIGEELNNLKTSLVDKLLDGDFKEFLKYGFVEIPLDKAASRWVEQLWRIDKRFWATSYIKIEEGWDQAYTKLGIEIQKTKVIVNNADIKRVFILDDLSELNQINQSMIYQSENNIKIKYILRSEIQSKSTLKNYNRKFASLDFGITDDKFVSIVDLNRNRKIKSAKMIFEKESIKEYEQFFLYLFNEAHEIKKAK